ncbi:hypothetical protein D9M69_408740 [compost metagenome]
MREAGANAAHPRFVVAAGDQQLHAGEQGLVALVFLDLEGCLALVAVAAQLIDGLGQRFGNGRALALHHHQRDAVHQQHQIRDDKFLAAVVARRAIDAVLVDHAEVVVGRGVPVDVLDGLPAPAFPAREAVDGDAPEQQLSDLLVGFHQLAGTHAGNGGQGFGNALLIQPGLAVAQVDGTQALGQRGPLNHLAEAAAAGGGRIVEAALGVLPVQPLQLSHKGFFDVFQFPAHRVTPLIQFRPL